MLVQNKVIFEKKFHVFILSLIHYSKSLMFCLQDIRVHILVQCMSPLPYFRDTLTFLTEAFCQSTLPFVWDDPTSIADLKQVSVDLANGAARGKSGGHQFPKTACLVTANFDIHEVEK